LFKIWTPLVVPESQDDVYTDAVMCLTYSSTPIPEAELPLLFVRKARKRQGTDLSSSGERKKHCRRIPPPSLFDQVSPRILKKQQRSKAQKALPLVKQQMYFARPLSALKSAADTAQDSPAWLFDEDVALLKAVKQLLALPLNLAVVSPAQTVNWDFVSDVVNFCNYAYLSPEQCQDRYTKTFGCTEGNNADGYPLCARQAHIKKQNFEHTSIYMNHFELMSMTARKRS
ncbi:EP400 protein, partial [Alectura lathami]|nr:EP400 protein [Alectura lathami]